MLFLIGWWPRAKTVERGTFGCPVCGVDRPYERRHVRQWLRLFFIPIAPLRDHGEHVLCASCRNQFAIDVLAVRTTAELQSAFVLAHRYLAVALVISDEPMTTVGRDAAVRLVQRAGQPGYRLSALDEDLGNLDPADAPSHLAAIAPDLENLGKEAILRSCVEVALADGEVTESELELIRSFGGALGMSSAYTRGVVAEVRETHPHGPA